MSISALFTELGAPLHNVVWSWGSASGDGTIFLRAWQDQTQSRDGKRFIRLAHHGAYAGSTSNAGYNERLRHLQALKDGAQGYVVVCRAVDPAARPRSIASFNDRDVLKLGEIVTIDGDEWGELRERVSIRSMTGGAHGGEELVSGKEA